MLNKSRFNVRNLFINNTRSWKKVIELVQLNGWGIFVMMFRELVPAKQVHLCMDYTLGNLEFSNWILVVLRTYLTNVTGR